METLLLDNEEIVKVVPVSEDRILVELPDEIEEPFDDIDTRLPEDVVSDVDGEPLGLPLADVESVVLVRTMDKVDEKLLSVGTDDTVLDVIVIATEGLPLSNADEPPGELVPLVDEDPPLWELLEIFVDDAADVKVLDWEPFV